MYMAKIIIRWKFSIVEYEIINNEGKIVRCSGMKTRIILMDRYMGLTEL